MIYTYLLQSKQNATWYTGYTHDLKKRLVQHNTKQSTFTKYRGPYELIYYEACPDERDAIAREKYLKTGMGKKFLKSRLKYYLNSKVSNGTCPVNNVANTDDK